MWKTIALAGVFFAISACAHKMPNHIPYVAPDGRAGWATQCNNWDQTFANCLNSARIVCGGDFEEINRQEHVGVAGSFWRMGSTSYPFRTLEYVCVNNTANSR